MVSAVTGCREGALGDHTWFGNSRQVYRSAGLNPIQYESAGKRRDSVISREGSVELRSALIDLGLGLWLNEPAAKQYATGLERRGKKGGVIACALAHRANKIAFAMTRDQAEYDPSRWTRKDYTRLFKTPAGSASLDQHVKQAPYRGGDTACPRSDLTRPTAS